MKEKQHYLVTKTTYFVDPHGTPDEGGVEKTISTNLEDDFGFTFEEWRKNKDSYWDCDEWTDEPSGSEDGYNSECESFSIKKITAEDAKKYSDIIKAYNKL